VQRGNETGVIRGPIDGGGGGGVNGQRSHVPINGFDQELDSLEIFG
jgi:hypothetical protein